MKTIASSLAFIVGILLAIPALHSQQDLHGKIVERNGDAFQGVPGVEVGVAGYDDDITGNDGAFLLHLPANWEQATVTLKNSSLKIIQPSFGEIKLPVSKDLEIQVCGAEKKRLLKKVEALETETKKLRRERSLSQQQIAKIHSLMLDTILHYEQVFQEKEAAIERLTQQGSEKEKEISALKQQVADLERQVADLERQLQAALEEKFRQQKKQFDAIAAALNNYLDQAKNLRDMLLPERLDPYFLNEGARERLYAAIEKYNAARKVLIEGQKGFVAAVAHDWEDVNLPDQLDAACDGLLKEIHDQGVYPLEFAVMDPLKQFLGEQTSRIRAEKVAKEGAKNGMPTLDGHIATWTPKIEAVISMLKENI